MYIEVDDRGQFKARMNDALAFDKRQAVVLTVDLQREYLDPSVGQAVVEPDEAERVLEANQRLLNACRAESIPVVHAYVVRPAHELDAGFHAGGLAYLRLGTEAGISQAPHRDARTRPDRAAGSPESEVPARLLADSDIHITDKKNLDSFAHTELEFLLSRVLRPTFVILTGINTDTCVYAATFGVANRGYAPIVVRDCVASMRGRDSHEMALELMSRSIAWVLDLDDLLQRFSYAE